MALVGHIGRGLALALWAQAYLEAAIKRLRKSPIPEPPERALAFLELALTTVNFVIEDLEEGMPPEMRDLFHDKVMTMERL